MYITCCDQTELRAFFCRHYCSFSFYSLPLFLKGRGKKGKERVIAIKKNARSSVSSKVVKPNEKHI